MDDMPTREEVEDLIEKSGRSKLIDDEFPNPSIGGTSIPSQVLLWGPALSSVLALLGGLQRLLHLLFESKRPNTYQAPGVKRTQESPNALGGSELVKVLESVEL